MIDATGLCPYVGLQPFREEDYPYFFGRERDVRVISSNLTAQPLTVLYGASGVGKSSVLRAGVMPYLRGKPDAIPVYWNTWQRESFLEDLSATCRAALGVTDPEVRFANLTSSTSKRLFLLLDQFEELLLYHSSGPAAEAFDSMLAQLVNRDDVAANVLIGIREDALSRFDHRYGIRIADLFGNTLPLDHLSHDAARRAILEPLRVFNERHLMPPHGYAIEPELTEEILRQVQPQKFAVADDDDRTRAAADAEPGDVETPFLQLVLRRLWDEEVRSSSRTLRLETLQRIGGAQRIVDTHVNEVLAGLPDDEDRGIAARMFKYLVTPSRSKIAQTTGDLIAYADAPEARVRQVLFRLADTPESRILRRLDTPERYEIFHDVLAQPVLDWRKRYFDERDRLEQQRAAERIRLEVRRLRALVGAMVVLLLATAGLAWYAFEQRARAEAAAAQAQLAQQQVEIAHQQADAARTENQAVLAQQRATQATLQALQAAKADDQDLAKQLRAAAAEATKQAADLRNAAQADRDKAAASLEGKDKTYRDAVQQIADLRRERDQSARQVNQLEGQIKQLTDQLAVARAQGSANSAARGPTSTAVPSVPPLSIGGVVRDVTGAVVPGVVVEASGPALIEKSRTTVTDYSGQYRITDLRPGTYALTFTLPGFTQARRERIELTGEFIPTVNVELKVAPLPRR